MDGTEFLRNHTTNTAVWGKLWNLDFVRRYDLRNKEGRTYEDLPMVFEGIINSNRIAKIDFPFYNYFIDNPNAITKKHASTKYLEDRLWLMNYLDEQREKYKDDRTIAKFVKMLMINQIIPALNNIRTYSGKDKKLLKLLLNSVLKYKNQFPLDFFKSEDIGFIKKTLILISPKLFLKLIRLFDLGKSSQRTC